MLRLLAGEASDGTESCLVWQAGDMRLFYLPPLRPKPYTDSIHIRLKRFPFIKRLELEGARTIGSSSTA